MTAVVVGAALASAMPAADAAGGSASEPDRHSAERIPEAAVEYFSQTYDISRQDALRRLRREPIVAHLHERYHAAGWSNWAGLWVDHTAEGRVQVAFRDHVPEQARSDARRSSVGGLVDFRVVEHAKSDLIALEEEIAADARRYDRITQDDLDYGSSVSVTDNHVEVAVDDRALKETLAGRYADEPVVVRYREVVDRPEVDCTRRDCFNQFRGGLRIANSQDGRGCTSGFMVNENDTGRAGFLSAGHCVTDHWYHGGGSSDGYYAGFTVHRHDRGTADTLLARLSLSRSPSRWVLREVGRYPQWRIEGWISRANFRPGRFVCSTGQSSGRGARSDPQCGEVISNIYRPGLSYNSTFYASTYCSRDGDSGGGIINARDAIGLHKSRTEAFQGGRTHCPTPEEHSSHAVSSAIQYSLSIHDVSLRT